MKKGFYIIILVLAINVTAPSANKLYLRQIHLIEYVQESNHRKLDNDELLKSKAILYLRYAVLANKLMLVDFSHGTFNNSS